MSFVAVMMNKLSVPAKAAFKVGPLRRHGRVLQQDGREIKKLLRGIVHVLTKYGIENLNLGLMILDSTSIAVLITFAAIPFIPYLSSQIVDKDHMFDFHSSFCFFHEAINFSWEYDTTEKNFGSP